MSYYRRMLQSMNSSNGSTEKRFHHSPKPQTQDEWDYDQSISQAKSHKFMVPKKSKPTKTIMDLLPFRLKMISEYQKKKMKMTQFKTNIQSAKHSLESSLVKPQESQVKRLEDLMITSNKNLQEMNMDMMNRLLTIIENNQNANLQLQLSKVQPIQQSTSNKHIIINNIVPPKKQTPFKYEQLLKKEIKLQLMKESTPFVKNVPYYYTQELKMPRAQSSRKFQTEKRDLPQQCQKPILNSDQKKHLQSSIINIDQFVMETYRSGDEKIQEPVNEEIRKDSNKKITEETQKETRIEIIEEKSQKQQEKPIEKKLSQEKQERQPVFMEIKVNDNPNQITLAEAFAKRIGKLSSQSKPKRAPKPTKQKRNKQNIQINLQIEQKKSIVTPINRVSMKTPQSRQPSEQLMNRLIHGSKAKVSKQEMLALTRKNYEKLPEVVEKKNKQKKKQLQYQRIAKIKEYQRSIRASKSTINSQN